MKLAIHRPRHAPITLLAAATLTITACMTPTPYQPEIRGQRIHGGYSEQILSENRYLVTFDGNTLTSRERVEGYLLYRAAELTVQNGYDWFRVAHRQTDRDQRIYIEPAYRPWHGYSYWRPNWRYFRPRYGWYVWHPYDGDPFWADDIDVRTVEEFEAHAEIIMGRGRASDSEGIFDARRIMADIGPSIERPTERR
jgi:hypothetical protein